MQAWGKAGRSRSAGQPSPTPTAGPVSPHGSQESGVELLRVSFTSGGRGGILPANFSNNPMAMTPSATRNHAWRFFRAGGFDQVRLDSGADLMALDQLNPKLWVALGCPTRGIEFDTATLDLIDTDKDGRIRVPEIIAAVKWAGGLLKNPDDLVCSNTDDVTGVRKLELSKINDSSADGKKILASAKQILKNLGHDSATSISVSDTIDTAKIFAQTQFNGDGIIPAEAATDDSLKSVITDIITVCGGVTDRSGKPGINQAKLDAFFTDLEAHAAWHAKAGTDATILPLGAGTAAAQAAIAAVRAKVDDYFSRCRLAAFDPRALAALNRSETEYLHLAAKDLSIDTTEVSGFPLARIEAGKPLHLITAVNPAWAGAVTKFHAAAVVPLLGKKDALTESDWAELKAKIAPYEAWCSSKAGAAVEPLGIDRIKAILASKAKAQIADLLQKDSALAEEANAIALVDRLVRYHRDLYRLLLNFVNFRDFYDKDGIPAVFQAGVLYLDQRSCDLCIRVEDMGKHAALAGLSKSYLAYCDVVRRHTGEKMTVACAFTDGDSDNLMVGRNGIFFDRKGNDWDATITKIVDHPISIRQAFWSPYKKFISLIESQIEKFASAREKAVQDQAASGIDATAKSAEAGKAAEKKEAFDVARFAGIFAAIGLAIGAIGGILTSILTGFLKLELWQMPLAIVGIMLVISGPSMLIAWLKLRQRNLGPILDANGWAVNSKAKINIPFGRALTGVAELPPGSSRDMVDPYAENHSTRNWIIAGLLISIILFTGWDFGFFHKTFPNHTGWLPKSSRVLEQEKVAAEKAKLEAEAAALKKALEEKK